jgi:hypothetical protein
VPERQNGSLVKIKDMRGAVQLVPEILLSNHTIDGAC